MYPDEAQPLAEPFDSRQSLRRSTVDSLFFLVSVVYILCVYQREPSYFLLMLVSLCIDLL